MLINHHFTFSDWYTVFVPAQIYLITVCVLVCYGDHGDEKNWIKQFFKRISNALERWTGYPGWAMAPALTGLLFLGCAAVGLYWDVGFHVDYGRDQQLFTPSHTMILIGLGGICFAAFLSVLFASLDEAPVDLNYGWLRIPWTGIALAAFGVAAVAAFPLDAEWHNAYGVDVTLWSPTHLQLILGGSLSTIILWLMLREGKKVAGALPTILGRAVEVTIFGAILVGVSTVQGEFDFGVPQFQVLYLPILLAVAAGFAIVLGRLAMGRWGAIKTVIAFLIIRGLISVLVAGPFNETNPHFPLYIVSALLIEGVAYWLGTENRLRFAVVTGLLVGTVGTFADLSYLNAIATVHGTAASLPKAALLSPIAAIAAAILAGSLSRPVGRPPYVPTVAAVVAGVALLLTLAYPLPRNVGNVQTDVKLTKVGDQTQALVEVDLQPANAAKNATAFGIVSWQGGGRISASLKEIGPGRYISSRPMPITGTWKTMVGLQRGSQVMAAPVYFPADPEIGAAAVDAVPLRHEAFVRNTKWLLREEHAGAAWAATAAYSGLSIVVFAWFCFWALCAVKLTPDGGEDESAPSASGHFGGGAGWSWSPPKAPSPAGHGNGNGNGNRAPDDDAVDDRYGLSHRQIVGASWGLTEPPKE